MLKRHPAILKWILYSLALLLAALLQTSLFNRLPLLGVIPNLIPVVAALVAIFEGTQGGAVIGFVAGLLCDALIPGVSLFFTLAGPAVGLGVGAGAGYLFRKNLFAGFFWSAVTLLILDLFYFLFFNFLPGHVHIGALLTIMLPEVLYSLLFVLPFYPLVRSVYRHFGTEEQEK